MKHTLWGHVRPYFIVLLISAPYSLAFNWCYTANDIAYGGFTGIAQMLSRLLGGPPVGVIIILMNIPIFFMAWKFLPRKMLPLSLFAMVSTSVAIDLAPQFVTFQPMEEPLLACIYGGVLLGTVMGVIVSVGGSTGGTDLSSRLLRLTMPWLPIGKVMMVLDLGVICMSALVFKNLDSALYGLVALYICTLVIDTVVYGMDKSQVAYIISDRFDEIAQAITRDLNRGVTLLRGQGAWSGSEKQVIMCAFKQRQIVTVKQMVKEIDPAAFLIVCPAYEVLGRGFRIYKKNDPTQ